MMITIEAHFLYALLASNALLVAAAALAISRFRNLLNRNAAFWASPTAAMLSKNEGERAIDEVAAARLLTLQKTVDDLVGREHARNEGAAGLPFENAVRMARQGATVGDLTRTCGLNKGEAELMMRLYARNVSGRAPARDH